MDDDTRREEALLTERDLCRWLGVTRQTVFRWRAQGVFPAPVVLGDRLNRWDPRTVRAWLRDRRRGAGARGAAA